jgi:hypothetical protein
MLDRRPIIAALMLLALAGCGAVREVDSALRRVDVLDRVFDPGRYRVPPPPPAAPPEPEVQVKAPEPDPVPVAVAEPAPVAEAPRPPLADPAPEPLPPPVTTAEMLRRNPWMTRFWSELTANQQSRVSRRLPTNAPARWDSMGLPDRARLFGAVS